MQRVLRKSSPASNNQIPQASLPVRAGALFSCRLSSFWKSAGLQNHRPLVRIHQPSLREGYYKTETPVPGSDTGVLGGRGWITQAALLKTAYWAVFALSSATAPQLFESTLVVLCRSSDKTETPASSQRWSSWWAQVDSNNHGFVPPKPFDSKKLGIMRIFGHPKWNTKPFRPGRNVKSGLQSGLFLGVRGVLG